MSDLLKQVIQDLINDRTEQAQVSIHDYIVAKTQEVTGLSEAIGKITAAKVKAAEARADRAELAVEREQGRSGYGRSNDKVRELKAKAQKLRSEASQMAREFKQDLSEAVTSCSSH